MQLSVTNWHFPRFTVSHSVAPSLCLGALLLAVYPAAAAEVRVNEVTRSLFYAPQYVALKIGAFEQEGLKIVGPKTTWGTQAALTEVESGNSDIALIGPEAATFTRDAGPDRRLIDFAQLTNGDGSFIISKTPIADFKITDLKNKTIVTSGVGTTPTLTLGHLLRAAGLDPAKDVVIRNMPNSGNIIPSYLDASASFAQVFEPMAYQAVSENKGYRVASIGALFGPMPYTAYMATASYIEKNPAIIQSFTNAVYRGLLWTQSHSAKEVAALVAPFFNNVPPETLEAVVTAYKDGNVYAATPLITSEGINQMMDLLIEGGILKQRLPYDQIVAAKYAKAAMEAVK